MNDEQFKELRSLIAMISDRVDHLELHLRRQDDIASHRHNLVYQWCAPPAYKNTLETAVVDIPIDLKRFFNQN